MSRIVLGVEYAGDAFEGWQTQPHGRTVQDVVTAAVSSVAGQGVDLVCAGRTDTGVHATTQIVHFDAPVERPRSAWVRGTNSHLPASVAIRWAHEVDTSFHARFSATARHYRYLLYNAPVRPALLSGRVGWFHLPLDEDRVRAAADRLAGTHDFSAFRAAACQAKSPVRTIRHARVTRHGPYWLFDFCADAFLHHMIRNLVGALVYVGKGKHPPEWMDMLLTGRDRSKAAPTFAPDGLYLCGVEYPDRWSLPDGGRIICPPELPMVFPCSAPESRSVD
ncbi:tRNA pseudouridine(38-40) synthase TruA [Nitrogeniibacter mangrovi]|uniref:tRNA pseudouridine synthase A n=1 Tax=Nitrogeniibacter mangrovi TaxID=2016596 RepID=A0A6C1B3Q7_9RHOO|nr:tRNA pseudouridine(38-40) synthase TruA [Nitrogeniibacter mangrovi]QID18187.1 tRNA pseudouridine(38-40) synthase TruA [Nitrogeniibacter mangrovi]